MGNENSYVGLDCTACNTTYSRITWDDWRTAGTITVYRGYCHSCCGESLPSVSWSGNVAKLGCKASGCSKVYGVITWATWKISGNVWRTRGYCAGCYQKKKASVQVQSISSLMSTLSTLSLKTIRDIPPENRVYEFSQKYASVGHSSVDNSVGYAESELKEDDVSIVLRKEANSSNAIISPNSISMNFQKVGYKLLFGLKGSSVHVAVSRISFKGNDGYRTYFHFGVILSGNTYKITGSRDFEGSYMLVHLLAECICINVCKSRKMCLKKLNSVWNVHKDSAYCVDRRLGHSVLSARIITQYLMNELDTPYEYAKLKKVYSTLDSEWPSYKLKTITNCYLFAQRFCKQLNKAHSANNDIKLPDALSIMLWSIGQQEWYEASKFLALWEHGKKTVRV